MEKRHRRELAKANNGSAVDNSGLDAHAGLSPSKPQIDLRVVQPSLIRAYLLLGIFDVAQEMGADIESELSAIGVTRELTERRDAFVSVKAFGQSVAVAVEKTGRRDFPTIFAAKQKLSDLGSVAVMLQTAATLGDSFSLLIRYGHLDADTFHWTVEKGDDGERLLLAIWGRGATPEEHRWCAELCIAQCHRFIEGIVGKRPPIERVYFAYPLGAEAAYLSRHLQAPIDCESELFGFEFPPGTLDTPLVHANAELNGILRQYMWGKEQERGSGLESRVRAVVRALLDSDALTIERVAQSVGCSSRTLQRRLRSESGITYSALVSEIRLDIAQQFLAGTDMSITDLSFAVGYSSPTNFTREFKKLCGSTPRDWRRENALTRKNSALFSPNSLRLAGAI